MAGEIQATDFRLIENAKTSVADLAGGVGVTVCDAKIAT